MPKTAKNHWDVALALVIGLVLTTVGMMGLSGMLARPSSVSAATETVEVWATVSPWLSFSVSPTSTALTPDMVTAAGGVNIASTTSITLTAGSNNPTGYSLDIKDANAGLYSGTTTYTISSASGTVVAGTDGYGAQATSSDTDVTIYGWYDSWGTDDVGALLQTNKDLADTATTTSDDITSLKLKAATASTTPPGQYEDTITLTITGNS